MTDRPRTLQQAIIYFSDKAVAQQYLVNLRWSDGVVCPKCGGKEHSYLTTRKTWHCKACKKQFSVKVGTIFENSPIGTCRDISRCAQALTQPILSIVCNQLNYCGKVFVILQ